MGRCMLLLPTCPHYHPVLPQEMALRIPEQDPTESSLTRPCPHVSASPAGPAAKTGAKSNSFSVATVQPPPLPFVFCPVLPLPDGHSCSLRRCLYTPEYLLCSEASMAHSEEKPKHRHPLPHPPPLCPPFRQLCSFLTALWPHWPRDCSLRRLLPQGLCTFRVLCRIHCLLSVVTAPSSPPSGLCSNVTFSVFLQNTLFKSTLTLIFPLPFIFLLSTNNNLTFHLFHFCSFFFKGFFKNIFY